MTEPFISSVPGTIEDRLERAAAANHEQPSSVAVRLIDEGLRMGEHPGVIFHDSPALGRVASLIGGPDVAEVIDVLARLETPGEARVTEAATWFTIHPSLVRVALAYYSAYRDEIERQIAQRRREAADLRARQEAEQTSLG